MKKHFPEFLATFIVVFCGTGSIIINQISGGIIGHSGIAVTFGLVIMAMVYAFPKAQFNPAVSLSLALFGLLNKVDAAKNIAFQFAGAFAASVVLKLIFPEALTLGATIPSGPHMQSFILEIFLMFFLVLAALKVGEYTKEIQAFTGVVVGGVVLLEAMFAGPISGASMNPARSFAPAILSGNLDGLWIYLTAPFIGAIGAFIVWKWLKEI
ncbi:MAG: aquaporin [Bacteroidetes bacterium]|nr:aquaporin [Bacteroidota bacterium]